MNVINMNAYDEFGIKPFVKNSDTHQAAKADIIFRQSLKYQLFTDFP